jgi:hypothetical protein
MPSISRQCSRTSDALSRSVPRIDLSAVPSDASASSSASSDESAAAAAVLRAAAFARRISSMS